MRRHAAKANIDVEVTAGASHYEDTQAANKAVGAMTHELAKAIKDNEKMTVVALGTLTNVAAGREKAGLANRFMLS